MHKLGPDSESPRRGRQMLGRGWDTFRKEAPPTSGGHQAVGHGLTLGCHWHSQFHIVLYVDLWKNSEGRWLTGEFLAVDHFSVLEGESNLYEFLTWHKGTRGHTASHPNCIPRPLKSSLSLAFCLVMQLRLVIMIPWCMSCHGLLLN